MKSFIVCMAIAGCMLAGGVSATDMPELAKKHNCIACHAIDRKVVGPSWNDVAARYSGDASAEAKLIDKVANGGWCIWGAAREIQDSRHVSDEDIKTLVKFALSLKHPVNTLASVPVSNPPSNTSSGDPGDECSNQIKSKKELQILKGKIDLEGSDDPPFEMLANNKVPTKKEKGAILLWVSEEKKCKQLGDEWRNNNYPPAVNAIFEKVFSDMLFLAADLYAAKISYGGFAKGQVKIIQEAKVNMAAVARQIREQQQAENQQKDDLAKQQKQMQQQQKDNKRRDELAEQQQVIQMQQLYQQQQQERRLNMPSCASLPPGMAGWEKAAGRCSGDLYRPPTTMPRTYNTNCTTDYLGNVNCTTR